MKKSYVKPELKVEVLELNQAIAACKTQGNYKLTFLGYGCSWCRDVANYDAGKDNDYHTLFSTTDAAIEYHSKKHNTTSPAMGVYDVTLNGSHVAYYEDLNLNAHLDAAEGDNRQDVKDNNLWGEYFQS